MKSTSAALVAYLTPCARLPTRRFTAADLFTIWLATGAVLTYCDVDHPVASTAAPIWRIRCSFPASNIRLLRRQRRQAGDRSSPRADRHARRRPLFCRPCSRARSTARRSSARRRFSHPGRSESPPPDRHRDSVQGPRVGNQRNRPHHGENHCRLRFGRCSTWTCRATCSRRLPACAFRLRLRPRGRNLFERRQRHGVVVAYGD